MGQVLPPPISKGKQGNAYILNRDNLPGALTQRQPCSTDSSTDTSLIPPGNQPQFGKRGPLNVFGPYSEDAYNQTDYAKARSTPAYFNNSLGTYLFFSGSTKVAIGSRSVQPPSLARVKVVTAPGQPAYLATDAVDTQMAYLSPGSPVVTSNGPLTPIVWVLDANVFRTAPLVGSGVPDPVLYAVDASTMKLLWSSTQSMLDVGGKYNHPVVARGFVFVGTDRIQAFGVGTPPPPPPPPPVATIDDAVQGTGVNQFHYAGTWTHCTSGCIAGSYHRTVSYDWRKNDYATIAFTGTQVKLYTDTKYDRGFAAISVDSGTETRVDMYSASAAGDVLAYTSPSLSPGNHTLRVRDTGARDPHSTGTKVAVDRVDIIAASPAAHARVAPQHGGARITTVDDGVSDNGKDQFDYIGGWTHCSSSCAEGSYDGTVSTSDSLNDRATIVFMGTRISLYADQCSGCGLAGVSVDGNTEQLVDLYGRGVTGDVLVFTSLPLGPGSHVLQIRNTGSTGPGSTGSRITLDRVDVTS